MLRAQGDETDPFPLGGFLFAKGAGIARECHRLEEAASRVRMEAE